MTTIFCEADFKVRAGEREAQDGLEFERSPNDNAGSQKLWNLIGPRLRRKK